MNSEKRKDIFVIEDSPEIRMLINLFFSSEGYNVEFASDGLEALNKLRLRKSPPGVILLDLMMPVMDGFEFRKEMEHDIRFSQVPVVVMSADAGVKDKTRDIKASGYIRKPLSLDTLIAVAEKFCEPKTGT